MYFVIVEIKIFKIVKKNVDEFAWGNLIAHIGVAVLMDMYRKGARGSQQHGAL